jgi:hypothetical protein
MKQLEKREKDKEELELERIFDSLKSNLTNENDIDTLST